MTDLTDKLDRIIERLGGIDVTLARQEENLRAHMRRTEQNEEGLGLLRAAIELLKKEMEPLKAHVVMWAGAAKALSIVGVLVGIAAGIAKLFGA